MSTETNGSTGSALMPDFDVKLSKPSKENPFGADEKGKNRTPTEFWLNVGVEVENPYYDKDVEGSQPTIFISLPLGIALDGIKESLKKIASEYKNPVTQIQMVGQHQLVEHMEKAMKTCQPGQRVVLKNLRAELYHVKKGETLATVEPSKNVLANFSLT